jgi:hypothetical protein
MIKKTLRNFSFVSQNKLIVSSEITWHILDQKRHERKVNMVIKDVFVDDYIDMNITDIDIMKEEEWKDLPENQKKLIRYKLLDR